MKWVPKLVLECDHRAGPAVGLRADLGVCPRAGPAVGLTASELVLE